MSIERDRVVVYAYRPRGVVAGFEPDHLWRYKAERKVVEEVIGGEVIEGTGEQVDRVELDEAGRFRRIATGWGELR